MSKISSIVTFFTLLMTFAFSNVFAGEAGTMEHEKHEVHSEKTLAVAKAFLEAAGSGDAEAMKALMADDFQWHNEGDFSIPWIGTWGPKDKVFSEFMPAFGEGLKVTSWTTDYSFSNRENAVFMGTMSAIVTKTGEDTGVFSWAVRVHVVDGKVKRWHWFEDSYAVSKAYHGN
ncbi:nuclear transport factor 2 family protein [Vibrio astriarenae]|uniref:nuclear transport factor 2 family protein n=1 Tax=Vibrio astriarenae TaxID=1481923 RepID=UPI003734DF8A